MSGDVQPRKRKDKKKKRDDESSHGVHITKMGSDDVHLHVHEEHGTGGHWCAKIIFFSLMTILLGLVCLIILENRGISDVDTPLSESRFSNYFDGWVDESRNDHDDHHDSHGSVEHDDHDDHDEDDDHNEPFEEEVDHSEGEEEEEAEEEEDENVTPEEEDDDDNVTAEKDTAEEVEDEEDEDDEDNATMEEDADDDNITAEDDNVTAEDDNVTAENEADDDDNVTEEATMEQNDDDDDEADANNTNEDDDNVTAENSNPTSKGDNDDDPFDEEDDDGTFESVEKLVDNDASELELLKEKARQQAAAEAKNTPESIENDDEAEKAPSWASSLAGKIGVGLALALVQRLVFNRKNPVPMAGKIGVGLALALVQRLVFNRKNPVPTKEEDEREQEPVPEVAMKRRLTIASEEEAIPSDADEILEPLPEDDYSEEEIEIEEEIEYIEEDEEPIAEENQVDAGDNDYIPETFEQLNAMYRTKVYPEETEQKLASKPQQSTSSSPPPPETSSYSSYQSPYSAPMNNTNNNNNINSPKESASLQKTIYNSTQNQTMTKQQPARFEAPPPPPLVEAKIDVQPKYSPPKEDIAKLETAKPSNKEVTHDMDYVPEDNTKKSVTYDMDYQPDDEDIDYDEDDIYDDEGHDDDSEDLDDDDLLDDDDEEDIGEGEDASDIDDTELMNRLEAKYGKLPAKEYESDEDPDDPTWTQIKPKTGGGPQSLEDDDDLFEQNLRRANDEMMREHYADALISFDQLIQKYPNKPQTYLGKAQTMDYYAEQQQSNRLLKEAIEYYKTYLDFKVDLDNLHEYRSAAERCLERLRFLGQFQQSLPIHQLLIEQFPEEPSIQNELAVTYLMQNRLLDAKRTLQNILKIWPDNGFALVHYGFVLKQLDHDYYNASIYLRKGIETNEPGTQDGRFYFQLGESLQRLAKQAEAVEIFRKGANLKLFPSIYQRSLYNEPNLKAQPFWSVEETTYVQFFKKLQDNWLAIQAEALNILSKSGYFQNESENLKNKGDWKQFELYARGRQNRENCMKAPITCSLIAQFPAARDCLRGQVKFSVMHEGTHVWPHCGPTNCRLRAHLGLVVPQGTRIRVAEEERSWQEGEFLIFDDSFEHEVWHEGQGLRLVLIIDIWHPDLSEQQRRSLSPI